MAEVKLGQLAEERGSNPAVKNFGRRMVQDHSKAGNELKSTASKANIDLPTEMDKSDQATYDRLSKLSGEAFDRAYARDMVKDHSKDVSEFQKEAKNGRDENIKNFAAQTLPTLQSHLDQARQMDQAVNQTSSSNSTSGNATGTSGSGNSNTYPSNNRTTPGTTSGTPSGTTATSGASSRLGFAIITWSLRCEQLLPAFQNGRPAVFCPTCARRNGCVAVVFWPQEKSAS